MVKQNFKHMHDCVFVQLNENLQSHGFTKTYSNVDFDEQPGTEFTIVDGIVTETKQITVIDVKMS